MLRSRVRERRVGPINYFLLRQRSNERRGRSLTPSVNGQFHNLRGAPCSRRPEVTLRNTPTVQLDKPGRRRKDASRCASPHPVQLEGTRPRFGIPIASCRGRAA